MKIKLMEKAINILSKFKFPLISLLAIVTLLVLPEKIMAETKMNSSVGGGSATGGTIIQKLPKTPNDPILENGGVYPMWGPVCQRYTYHTTYRDKEGRPPEYVRMYFNGKWIDVEKEDPNNNDYKKGVAYAYKFVPNKLGSNFFFFEASNGVGKTREGIIDSPGNGPVLFEGDFKHNAIALIDVVEGKKVWEFPTASVWVSGVAISDDGGYVAAITAQKIYLFETASSKPIWTYATNEGGDTPGDVKGGIDISGDGSRIFASVGNRAYLFNNKSNKPIWTTQTGSNGAYSVAISKDGAYMAVGTAGDESNQDSNLIVLWNGKSNKPLWKYHASGNFHEVSLSDDGSYIAGATGCPDRRAYIFAKNSNQPIVRTEMLTRDSPVDEAQISGDGNLAAFGLESDQGGMVLLNNKSNQPLWRFDTVNHPSVRALAITADGNYIAGGDFRGRIYLLNKDSNQPSQTWNIPASVGAIDIADDGIRIAAGGADNRVHIFEKGSGTQKSKIDFEEYVGELEMSANGKYAVAGTSGSTYFFETFSPNEGKVFPCTTVVEPSPRSQTNIGKSGEGLINQITKETNFLTKIVNWIRSIFKSKQGKNSNEGQEGNLPTGEQGVCGNTMCEPVKGESKESCPKDCSGD